MPITTEAELRRHYGEPIPRAVAKTLDRLDHHCRSFIGASPFMVLATSDGLTLDASPKGDGPGFVAVEDDQHLLIPDRPGNNRLDGLVNLLASPNVGCLFLIPGVRETLRVNGRAAIHAEPEVLDLAAQGGRRPVTVIRVEVREAYIHCAKAFLRSRLWEPASWPAHRPVAVMSDWMRDQADYDAPEDDAAMTERYRAILAEGG